MPFVLFPNQKAVRIIKTESNTYHPYSLFNRAATEQALYDLRPSAFKVWAYLNLNADEYELGLSSTVLTKVLNLSKETCVNAIKELLDKGYLVRAELYPGLKGYLFLELRDDKAEFEETILL